MMSGTKIAAASAIPIAATGGKDFFDATINRKN